MSVLRTLTPTPRGQRRATVALLMLLASIGGVRTAHAGMFEWVDNAFTFRKDQKERVTPRRVRPPKVVTVPYYPADDHAAWSDHYTRQDLTAQPYLDGSASKVMRTAPEPVRQPLAYGGSMEGAQNPQMAQDMGGWEAIERRNYENSQMGRTPDILIGEPEENFDSGMASDLGRGTQIGAPVGDWRSGGTATGGFAARPGDYDYRPPAPRGGLQGGETVAGRSAEDIVNSPRRYGDDGALAQEARRAGDLAQDGHAANPAWQDDPRYLKFNEQGQVTRYKVQRGDTLGGIAAQEAIYANWKLWPLIYSANRKAIGGDPANLKVDRGLVIPRGYTTKQAQQAESRAERYGKK